MRNVLWAGGRKPRSTGQQHCMLRRVKVEFLSSKESYFGQFQKVEIKI